MTAPLSAEIVAAVRRWQEALRVRETTPYECTPGVPGYARYRRAKGAVEETRLELEVALLSDPAPKPARSTKAKFPDQLVQASQAGDVPAKRMQRAYDVGREVEACASCEGTGKHVEKDWHGAGINLNPVNYDVPAKKPARRTKAKFYPGCFVTTPAVFGPGKVLSVERISSQTTRVRVEWPGETRWEEASTLALYTKPARRRGR